MLGEIERIPSQFLHDQKTSIGVFRGYTIIKIKDDKKANVYRYYAFAEKDKQGEGSFGKVYAARSVDPKTGEFKNIVAVKVIGSDDRESPQELYKKEREANKEAKRLRSKHLLAETSFLEKRRVFVVMDFAKGKELNAKEFAKDVNCVFAEAVKLIWFLTNDLNRLHHETKHGRALIHSDLKVENSRVDVEKGKVRDARIIDFGFTQKVNDDAMQFVINRGGTYLAPEQEIEDTQGLKSDIYSFGLMCQSIFQEFAKTIPEKLRIILHSFLEQMINQHYAKRPNTDEVLTFFTALNNYCILDPKRSGEFLEKLEVLAIPEKVLSRDKLPIEFENYWRLFLYVTEHYENHQKKWSMLSAIIKSEVQKRPVDEQQVYAWIIEFIKGTSQGQFSEEQKRYFFQFLKEFLHVNHPRREESKRCIRVLLQHNEKEWQKIVETRSVEQNPEEWLRQQRIPDDPHNQWRLFLCAAIKGSATVNREGVEFKQAVVKNRALLTEQQRIVEKAITDFFSHPDEDYRKTYEAFFCLVLKKYLDRPTPKRFESIQTIANPEAILAAKQMPRHIKNVWRLFIAASKNYREYKEMWEKCREQIQKNIDEKKGDFGPDDQRWFKTECRSHRSLDVSARK